MATELADLVAALPPAASPTDYAHAIVHDNLLAKPTTATRRSTRQRLAELYGLDPKIPLFRVLRRVWATDESGRPLVALLAALARDPLLRATAAPVVSLSEGAELVRTPFLDAIREAVGGRLNDAVLDKVARNAASSWSQAGHLVGRVRKVRRRVRPTPGSVAFALWLGSIEGTSGEALLDTRWTQVLDRSGRELLPLALEAKQLGLIHARAGAGVIEIDPNPLDARARVA
jgi:hypothetical protein